jgi:quinol-cytochrome oxidoreductase complex cytochrome b subunit
MAEHVTPEDKPIPFYPDHFWTEVKVAIGLTLVLAVIGVVGLLRPPELGAPADPMNTPLHIKPEWYFLAVYEAIKYIPKTLGATLPLIIVGLLAAWPFIDRKPDTSRRDYRVRGAITVVVLIIAVILSYLGRVS